MTISHVMYLEFARLIVSWQWVTEVKSVSNFCTGFQEGKWLNSDYDATDKEKLDSLCACRGWLAAWEVNPRRSC